MLEAKKTKGLGKGFAALMPEDFDQSILLDPSERIQKLAVGIVHPNADQPRQEFDEAALNELTSSVKRYGILSPLVVTPQAEGGYRIIAGERRWRAAQKAGLKTVPAIVRSSEALEQLEIALIENVQRVDLSPLEQATSIQRLHEQFSLSYNDIAERLGKASTTVVNIARLLQLSPKAQAALRAHHISEGHARAVLSLKTKPTAQQQLLDSIMEHGWSVRQAEAFVRAHKGEPNVAKQARAHIQNETPATKALSKALGAPVTIRRTAKGGKLEIGFKTDQDLGDLLDRLGRL